MNNRTSFASLSPTLLARKGGARPAMRPQLQPLRQFHENTARQLEDLGWDDMGSEAGNDSGDDAPEAIRHEAEIVAFNPGAEPIAKLIPEVVHQQETIVTDMIKPRRSALSDGRRAAFTLRLDAERHLKLRLACVTSNRSAQQLITEALDRLIDELPEVTELAAKVRKRR